MPISSRLPDIPDAERTPLVEPLVVLIEALAEENHRLAETVQQPRDEIAVLKGEKPKPTFEPSGMARPCDPEAPGDAAEAPTGRRAGSAKRRKTRDLSIPEDGPGPPSPPPPPNARFEGYRDFVVRDPKIPPHHSRYRLEVWRTPDGEWWCGELPPTLEGGPFGPGLRAYGRYPHPHCHVAQPLWCEQLRAWGIDLSAGQIDALPSGHNEGFFAEKDRLLAGGLAVSAFIAVDGSGARHQGRNGYVTQIGNDFVARFSSTESKRRINFRQRLRAGTPFYGTKDEALGYGREQGLPQALRRALMAHPTAAIVAAAAWEQRLDDRGRVTERHRRIAPEGAWLGGRLTKGLARELAIVSDGAGQFAIWRHALGWVHAERPIRQPIPLNERHRQDQERVRDELWTLRADLKADQRDPHPAAIAERRARFEALFTQKTSWVTLDQTPKRLHAHRAELLRVLLRPDIPPHTNGSENDLRG